MRNAHQRYFGGLAADSYGTADDRPPLVLLHGLAYDRRQWGPTLRELAVLDPDRRVVSFDLPGHGDSTRRDSYRSGEIAAVVHQAVTEAGLDAPVLAGHSLGGVLATVYAAAYPARGVVNVDQPLLPGGFGEVLRRAEPVLRSPAYGEVWNSMLAGMHVELLPPAAQELVRTATTPRQDLLLGYWNELMVTPAQDLNEGVARGLDAIRASGIAYHYVSGDELDPAYREWLESALPDVTITVLPGSGHFPHLAHPAELATILMAMTMPVPVPKTRPVR
jgi:pimeloyl-ACP methyl ester carboxylesterase